MRTNGVATAPRSSSVEITDASPERNHVVTSSTASHRTNTSSIHYPHNESLQPESIASDSLASHHYQQHHHHARRERSSARRREWLNDGLSASGFIPQSPDYWTLPRHPERYRRPHEFVDGYHYPTPGGMLFSRKAHNHRSFRKTHKHRTPKEARPLETSDPVNRQKRPADSVRSSLDDLKIMMKENRIPHRSELKVYFRFSKGAKGEQLALDFIQNEPFLLALQAHCRGYLARRRFEQTLEKHHAVRVIQRNCERIFNPWVRLLMSLRPLLKCNRVEEELMFLRSELERYKTLVKMLRFENAEYQAKVANLLHLIEQINTKGSESAVVNDLIKQISEALTKNQEFWQEMAANNQALQSAILPRSALNGLGDGSPITPNSPMTRLRHDADFYRNQVELLKEEADEQQHRSSEHFQGQVSVLSNRMENLQHLLALESGKVERLSEELEEMNNTITEARNYERNLEHMVSQLSKQLEQKNKASEASTATPTTQNGEHLKTANEEAIEKELNAYRQLVSDLRAHLSANPKAMSYFVNTPFQPGGTHDLFQDSQHLANNFVTLEPMMHQQLAGTPSSPEMERSEKWRVQLNQEVVELKRQLTLAENTIRGTEERVRNEIEDREMIESENRQLQNRVSALDRELRCVRDEFEESLNRRDLLHQRELKELTDQLEEEIRKSNRLAQQNKDLDRELIELRNSTDADESILNDEWESMKSKLKADILHYKRSLDVLQEEYDQYRQQHDSKESERQLAERDERISLLEREQQQWRVELDVQQVKLQNTTNLLEDAEKRLKQATRERTTQIHRISQLESERDAAIREAATIYGRASAEKEHISAKLREYEDMKVERDTLRKELIEVKQTLAGCTAEIAAEKRQAQARLKDLTSHQEVRVADLKTELERTREEVERLQAELQSVQASEAEHKSAKQQSRWRINDLEDQLSHSLLRISGLERHNADLDAELVRVKAELSAAREAANLLRASRTIVADEWMQGSVTGEDTDDDALNKSMTMGAAKTDYGLDTLSEDSTSTPVISRNRLGGGNFRSASHYRSNPALYRSITGGGRSQSASERSSFRKSSSNILEEVDRRVPARNGRRPPTIVRELDDSSPKDTTKIPSTNHSSTVGRGTKDHNQA